MQAWSHGTSRSPHKSHPENGDLWQATGNTDWWQQTAVASQSLVDIYPHSQEDIGKRFTESMEGCLSCYFLLQYFAKPPSPFAQAKIV
jgi:hypothetical protein